MAILLKVLSSVVLPCTVSWMQFCGLTLHGVMDAFYGLTLHGLLDAVLWSYLGWCEGYVESELIVQEISC